MATNIKTWWEYLHSIKFDASKLIGNQVEEASMNNEYKIITRLSFLIC